ncbi:hypothetical protein JCM10908_002747 [Rhodotorula pacifica]|uniref:uncharacterized protein n=1 Tax=Rhodotorula pacifica TaxID=1495444 RepID=UPI00317EBE7B
MDQELSAASDFLASYLAHSHSQFSQTLAQVLAERYNGHWFPAEPERGSAFRALVRSSHADLDHSILAAARKAGVPLAELERALTTAQGTKRVELGDRWTLWIDPGCVSLRVDRGDASTAARDAGRFVEIWGKLPDSLRSLVVPLERTAAITAGTSASASSSNIGAADLPPAPASPVKRTRAVQIVAPPGGRNALQAMTNAALQPDSPAPRPKPAQPTALLASPLIIPPTPVRPLPAAEADVFSPTPAAASARAAAGSESSLLVPPRSPSPLSAGSAGSAGAGKKLGHSLSPLSLRPSSPLGSPVMGRQRRSLSRDSSASSLSAGSSDDGELSACDSIFSTGADSTTSSAASSVHALSGAATIWKGLDAKSRDLVDADGFRIPARPSATGNNGHTRTSSSSSSSLAPPPSPGSRHLFSPSSASSSSSATARSAPNSPSKPRRRGVRGGQGHRSAEQGHGRSSSVSSNTSVGSTAIPTTPSQSQSQALSDSGSATTRATTPSGRSSSFSHERSPSANAVATEYSNGLVKVLGGGVLLGCAKSASSNSSASNGQHRDGSTRTPGGSGAGANAADDGSRRRRRERGRGGRGGRENDRSGATSPFQPVSPNWMPHASPFQHHHQHTSQQQQQQMYQYHGSYPNSPYNHGYPSNLPPSPLQ